MGYRGRLIFPFVAELARLDLEGTAADPDGAGPMTTGFDDVLQAPLRVPDGTVDGATAETYLSPIKLRCQVEDESWEQLRMMRTGDAPASDVILVFHFKDLELLGYVDATTGDALAPRVGDKLVSIRRSPDDTLVQAVHDPPGLYCVEAQPRSYGLSGLRRNLLACTFRDRPRSSPTAGR